jgi:predicted RNA polymerase sigma factor
VAGAAAGEPGRVADSGRAESTDRRPAKRIRTREDATLVADPGAGPTELGDDTLLLLFLCCHPDLSAASQVALTLRAVGGLTTREIADAFFVPEATMAQRISRAKRAMHTGGSGTLNGGLSDVALVLRVLSLIYHAGHNERHDLADEAIRLTRQLTLAVPEPEARGLLALMLLQHARLPARLDAAGRLVTLDEQDRTLWNTVEIAEGVTILQGALVTGSPGRYQIQAAIAALHADATSADETDWPQVLAWYDDLLALSIEPARDDPAAVLSRAVAVGHVEGWQRGMDETERVQPVLGDRDQWHAVRAYLLEQSGQFPAAAAEYAIAARLTRSVTDRDHLIRRAARARSS